MILESAISLQNSLVNREYLETIKALDGKLYHLEYHQKRLESAVGKNLYDLKSLLSPPKDGLFRCRVVYDMQSVRVSYIPYEKRDIQTLKLVVDDTISYEKKFAQRDSLERLFAKRESADDVLIVKNGLLSDTTIANIALYDGKRWLTPKSPLLEGTTRRRYLDRGKIFEADIAAEDIKSYKKVALMNAMIDFDIIAEENIGELIC